MGPPPGCASPDLHRPIEFGAGEDVSCKQNEAGMRFLLDTYIQAPLASEDWEQAQ